MRPRLSAGVILHRADAAGGCEIYWVRRSKSLRFMGGWHAFPGGRLDARDAHVQAQGVLLGEEAYLASGPPAAHPVCALRELFEETGILAVSGPLPDGAELQRARGLLLDDSLDFGDWLQSHELALDRSRLSYAGRWVTPPLSPIRFDATFFLLEWTVDEPLQPHVIPGELSAGEWIGVGEALRLWEHGDVLLAQPTLATLRVLADHGVEDGRERLWHSQAHEPNSPHLIEFRPAIRVIPLAARTLPPATHTNTFLLGGRDLVLVDPGSPWNDELERLQEIVDAECRLRGGRLQGIWLSHHHDDHVAGAEALRRHYEVPISAHAATAAQLAARGIPIDGRLEGGERVELRGGFPLRIRVLHTPGHAGGHLCFFEERTATLLCGDMVSGYGTVVINPPDGNMAAYLDSLAELAGLGARVLLPSHGSMIPDAEEALRNARRHRLWREGRVLEVWERGQRDPEAMLEPVYGELAPAARPIAVRQILAHLERLDATGRIRPLPHRIRASLGRS